nr:PI-PLC X domain-containing protein At5g67130-like [Ipomoea trifida]
MNFCIAVSLIVVAVFSFGGCAAVKVKGVPFNRHSWLTTRNSIVKVSVKSATGDVLGTTITETQEDSVIGQLRNGVRGLMLDMYDFSNDIWLCLSSCGKCIEHSMSAVFYGYYLLLPVITVLSEIKVFLEANPSEIVTVMIEDYVTKPNGITNVFRAAGLGPFWFPVSLMPKSGEEWLTVDEMIEMNARLVVFSSESTKESSEGIAYKWRYFVENEFGTLQRGFGRGAAEAVDEANGQLLCGCANITHCKVKTNN